MKASLVSATSMLALLAFEGGPVMAGPLVTLLDTDSTCTNSPTASSCSMTFYALPGTASSQSQTVTAQYASSNTHKFNVTFETAPSPYSGMGVMKTINPPTNVTSNAYNFTGAASAGASGESSAAAGSFTVIVNNNTVKNASQTSTVTLQGITVAPIESMAGSSAGPTLVLYDSKTVTATVTNSGHGNLSGLGAVSNLNGTIGSAGGVFSGPSPNPNPISITDGGSVVASYLFSPTVIGATSTTVTGNFSNGAASGTNASHTNTATISGTGVAPLENVSVTNSGNPGSVANTGQVGYALVGVNTGTATIHVLNSGNGNLDTSVSKSISNLNGVVGTSGSSVFTGSGTSLSLNDSTTTSTNYTFNPTIRGTVSTQVVTTFSDGSSMGGNFGKNLSETVTTGLTGQGVAPVNSVTTTGTIARFNTKGAPGANGTTSSNAGVTINNTGDGNLSGLGSVSNLNGSISGPSGPGSSVFTGPPAGTNPISLLDTSSTSVTYVYSPTARAINSASVTASFINGSSDSMNNAQAVGVALAGQGVGPTYNSALGTTSAMAHANFVAASYNTPTPNTGVSPIAFGTVGKFTTHTDYLDIGNTSTDPNGGNSLLTDLSLEHFTLSGSHAFSIAASPTVLHEGNDIVIAITFTAGGGGHYLGDLVVGTDESVGYGAVGDTFTYALSGYVQVPEPGSVLLLSVGLGGVFLVRRRKSNGKTTGCDAA
jgi:PEP-CTERM motif